MRPFSHPLCILRVKMWMSTCVVCSWGGPGAANEVGLLLVAVLLDCQSGGGACVAPEVATQCGRLPPNPRTLAHELQPSPREGTRYSPLICLHLFPSNRFVLAQPYQTFCPKFGTDTESPNIKRIGTESPHVWRIGTDSIWVWHIAFQHALFNLFV